MSYAIWVTGVPGCGKTAVTAAAARALADSGEAPVVLELDALRATLVPVPGPGEGERELVHRALVYLAATLTGAGLPVLIDATGHRRVWRDLARAAIPWFAEVHLVCPLALCRQREQSRAAGHAPRGVRAAAGRPGARMPGVDLPYEPPVQPELVIDTARTDVQTAAASVAALARALGALTPSRLAPAPPAWVIWLTGLPGSGKTTLASALARRLDARGVAVRLLDVPEARAAIAPDLRLDAQAEDVMYRALACAATLLAANGVRAVVDAAAPRRAWRDLGRALAPRFAEVQLLCTTELCGQRERAVRWRLTPGAAGRPATSGDEGPELVTGYQAAFAPELTIRTDVRDPWSAAEELVRLAERLERSTEPSPFTCEELVMRVSDLMTRDVITVRGETPVFEARALMLKQRIRHLLITEGDRLMGLITDRDIRLNLPSPATSLSVWEVNHLLARLTVAEVMTKSVIAVEPDRDAREAAMIMLDHKIGALPVIEGTRLIGILTETDLVRAFARSAEPAAAGR